MQRPVVGDVGHVYQAQNQAPAIQPDGKDGVAGPALRERVVGQVRGREAEKSGVGDDGAIGAADRGGVNCSNRQHAAPDFVRGRRAA